jgi:hypothetical protein
MPTGASFKGVKEMQAKLKRFGNKFPDEVGRALFQESQVELTEVKRRTPVDRGNLRSSEHVVGPVIINQGGSRLVYCLIVAGGPSAPYAVYVHEDPDAFHKVGQWKYIESVIMESRQYMAARVAKRIELNRALA